MFDSGADRSILHANIFNQLPANIKKLRVESRIYLCAVGKADREIRTDGKIKLPVVYEGQVMHQTFIISNEINDACILGWDAIKSHGFILNGANQSIFLGRVNSVQITPPQSELVLTQRVTLLPMSAASCSASIKGPIKKDCLCSRHW